MHIKTKVIQMENQQQVIQDTINFTRDLNIASNSLSEIDESRFYLEKVERIPLRGNACTAVLFILTEDLNVNEYNLNLRAKEVVERTASVITNDMFLLDLSNNPNLMAAFQELREKVDHPMHDFVIPSIPSVLVFRPSSSEEEVLWPKIYFTGTWEDEQVFKRWMMEQACQVGYKQCSRIDKQIRQDVLIEPVTARIQETFVTQIPIEPIPETKVEEIPFILEEPEPVEKIIETPDLSKISPASINFGIETDALL